MLFDFLSVNMFPFFRRTYIRFKAKYYLLSPSLQLLIDDIVPETCFDDNQSFELSKPLGQSCYCYDYCWLLKRRNHRPHLCKRNSDPRVDIEYLRSMNSQVKQHSIDHDTWACTQHGFYLGRSRYHKYTLIDHPICVDRMHLPKHSPCPVCNLLQFVLQIVIKT